MNWAGYSHTIHSAPPFYYTHIHTTPLWNRQGTACVWMGSEWGWDGEEFRIGLPTPLFLPHSATRSLQALYPGTSRVELVKCMVEFECEPSSLHTTSRSTSSAHASIHYAN